ncbi:MAG TPA: DUF2087 domain-containing protein [Streptosporangiaceae bacterium]|nr:DUF2087 domain-containing protein [Streptosporangiaceae bacterium]
MAGNGGLPELDPAAVLEAMAGHPQLQVFVGGGRIETLPARPARRRLLLDVIAQAFEPGVRYPEPRVSQFLGAIYPDHAALRRYLVDEEFLSRAGGEYWRSGGTVLPAPAPDPPAPPGGGGR